MVFDLAMIRSVYKELPGRIEGYRKLVGRPLTRHLRDAGEEVCVVDLIDQEGVDVVGDVLEREVLERAAVADARAMILNLGQDSTTQFAAKFVRQYAPDLPIIAGVMLRENVGRIQKAGADFAISLSQVAGQLLAHHVLGETVSLQPRIKLVKMRPGPLEGKNPFVRGGCRAAGPRGILTPERLLQPSP